MKKRVALILLLPLLICAILWWMIKYIWAILFSPDDAFTLAISVDQLANSAFNGNPDETISSRAYRHTISPDEESWAIFLCKLLNYIEPDHCSKSKGV